MGDEKQQAPRTESEVADLQAKLIALCETGDGEEGLRLAESYAGIDFERLQLLGIAKVTVGEARSDADLVRAGVAHFAELDETVGAEITAYNRANGYAAIWTIAVKQNGPVDALLRTREDLFLARDLYWRVATDEHEPQEHHLQALTNLGNSLDSCGRHLEALDAYDRALGIAPRFGMALGNRGTTLLGRAARLPDFQYPLVCEAIASLDAALSVPQSVLLYGGKSALDHFAARRSEIKGTPTHSHDGRELTNPHLEWCRRNELFLHPSHVCITDRTELLDGLRFHGLFVGLDEAAQARLRSLQDALNSLLQDYIAARYLGWASIEPDTDLRRAVDPINRHAHFSNSLIYARWGAATGLALIALAAATNLLDKVAGVTHLYLDTGRAPARIYFNGFWHQPRRKNQPIQLEPSFHEELENKNLGLLALCDLSCELERPTALSGLIGRRHAITHRSIAVHDMLAGIDEDAERWVERLTAEELRDGVLEQLSRGRAALTYLVDLIIEREQRNRGDSDLPTLQSWPGELEDPELNW